MKVLVTGATGFIGSKLIPRLIADGHEVHAPVRNLDSARVKLPTGVSFSQWPDATAPLPEGVCEKTDAVIHLAGESIAEGRWTSERKMRLRDSRIKSTERLYECFMKAKSPPKVFISASAVGYYGNRADEALSEQSSAGDDFLAKLTRDWENAATQFSSLGSRVVCVRTGIVLGSQGGALEKLLPAFKFGFGGKLGSGQQWMSWIHIEDLLNIYLFALKNEQVRGAVNAVSMNPTRNSEFTKVLGGALGRPAILIVPALALKLALGELSGALLGGARVTPAKLQSLGFQFLYPDLNGALKNIISGQDA
jgi:uncharacterized protein (TIGR01777 family)